MLDIRPVMRGTWTLLLVGALAAAGCTGSGSTESTSTTDPNTATTTVPTQTSDPSTRALAVDPVTHTVAALSSVENYEQIAAAGIGGQAVAKFSITEFATDPEIVWLDSNFYTLHDEWYWFQLLNGRSVRGFDTEPVDGPTFDSIDDVYDWARTRSGPLPLDLAVTSTERLYSNEFYETVLDASANRRLGVGALLRIPGASNDGTSEADRWLIELEFSDDASPEQIDRYFEVVGSSLPRSIADRLEWVPRSRAQELTAATLEASDSPNSDRVVRYDELAEPGDVEVYSAGIAAGRILVITDGGRWSLSDAGPDDIVVIDRAPDDLPPGNGLITGTPQTPLAHVNVLALNRGIPNAYLAGLADDPTIAQLGRVRSRVLIQTTTTSTGSGELEIVPLTEDEYQGWLATRRRSPITVAQADPTELDFVTPLDTIVADTPSAAALDELRPVIGGKAAGFVELALPGTTTMPPDAVAITVRPYVEHMAQFAPMIDAIAEGSTISSSPRAQFLVLEGRDDYDERFTATADVEFADDFERRHPPGDDPLGAVLAAGGFVEMIRDSMIDRRSITALTTQLAEHFADYSTQQGLRFRSSSTAEDIEGFNGAGLYDSNTGYLDPTTLSDPDDHKRTVERAVLRTWSSYWSATAFAERQREAIDHRSGAMAVLVHARFDDPLEVSNGVATLTVAPRPDTAYEMVVNVQAGAVSVTNADDQSGERPEVFRVIVDRAGERRVERSSPSSIVAPRVVLDDATAGALFDQLRAVADSWLERANAERPIEQRNSTLTLDFEFRQMAAGWPARSDGRIDPAQMIVKQARTLDPGLRGLPDEVIDLPVPRDVLAYAATVTELTCPGDPDAEIEIVAQEVADAEAAPQVDAEADAQADSQIDPAGSEEAPEPAVGYAVRTDPLARIDLGFAETPFTVWTAQPPDDLSGCAERTMLSTPQQYLRELLATR